MPNDRKLANEIVESLRTAEKSYYDETLDLKKLRFISDGPFGKLVNGRPMFLTSHSFKQLCKRAHIPGKFFRKASAELQRRIYSEATNLDESEFLFKIARENDGEIIRAVLPTTYTSIPNSALANLLPDLPGDWRITVVNGVTSLDQGGLLHLRVVRNDANLSVGDYLPAVSLIGSDLGVADVGVELVVFRLSCANGALTTFGNCPMYQHPYSGVFGDTLLTVTRDCWQKIPELLDMLGEAIIKARQIALRGEGDVMQVLSDLLVKRSIDRGTLKSITKNMGEAPIANYEDLANSFTRQAQHYSSQRRLNLERIGGRLLNLNFPRNIFPSIETVNEEATVGADL